MRLSGQQRPGGSDGDGILNVTATTQDFKHTCDMVTFYRSGRVGVCMEHGSDLDRSWCRRITVDCGTRRGGGTPQSRSEEERTEDWEQQREVVDVFSENSFLGKGPFGSNCSAGGDQKDSAPI